MWTWIWAIVSGVLVIVVVFDLVQKHHAVLRNFPLIGHFRYLFELVGPELRQYIVTSNDEERPFDRDQRRWIYASAKQQNSYFGFGTDNDLEQSPNHVIIKHATLGESAPRPGDKNYDPQYTLPCAKVLGASRRRSKAFRPNSVINLSAMSFGSLSAAAVEALNRGARISCCLHNSGEGGISPHHMHGAELIWQLGTGYFGCRDRSGRFDLAQFKDTVARHPIRAIEIKLSQGAKPGMGGVLPATKISKEIAKIRGIPMGEDCLSPAAHSEFGDADSMLDFVEKLADESGLPVGIKSAVGQNEFWTELATLIATTDRGVDFITIDGGEGGTGAGPLVFTDHVALPFKLGFSRIFRIFAREGLSDRVLFTGSGRLGLPEEALLAFALGCDTINVGREAMLAVGCIQAQRCHTGHCPTGVATQSKWLMRGLDPTYKAARLANYIVALRKEILLLSRACGTSHPALLTGDHFELLNDHFGTTSLYEVFGYDTAWGMPSRDDRTAIARLMNDEDTDAGNT